MTKYRIVKRQKGVRYEPFYELQYRFLYFFWICECWSMDYDTIKALYNKLTNPNSTYTEFEILESQ